MKRIVISLLLSMCAFCASFAQEKSFDNRIVSSGHGDYSFETSFAELKSYGVNSKIKVQNNSSFSVSNLICNVFINGKSHTQKPINTILSGNEEKFDGYDDEEMKDEFPCFFGADGKFRKGNKNKITFVVSFRPQQKNVTIKQICFRKKSILFVIDNSTEGKDALNNIDTSEKVFIDGKPYVLFEGKFIPIDDK